MKSYRIYGIENDLISSVSVISKQISDYTVNGISIGEKGRGRREEFLPINAEKGEKIDFVSLGETKNGKPRFWKEDHATEDQIIIVAKPYGGFRGCLCWGGKFREEYDCPSGFCSFTTPNLEELTSHAKEHHNAFKEKEGKFYFYEDLYIPRKKFVSPLFPETVQVIATGLVADGAAGRVGDSEHRIFILPKNITVSYHKSGRTYGSPNNYEIWWDGTKPYLMTPKDRDILDL